MRDLRQLSKSEAQHILDQTEQELVNNPESNLVLKSQITGIRRYRVGDFRVIYSLLETEIRSLRTGHHRDVYNREI